MKKKISEVKRIVRGRPVNWGSQGGGKHSVKTGRIVKLILPRESALDAIPGRLQEAKSRSKRNFQDISDKTERYLIEVSQDVCGVKHPQIVLYCARASKVKEIKSAVSV